MRAEHGKTSQRKLKANQKRQGLPCITESFRYSKSFHHEVIFPLVHYYSQITALILTV